MLRNFALLLASLPVTAQPFAVELDMLYQRIYPGGYTRGVGLPDSDELSGSGNARGNFRY